MNGFHCQCDGRLRRGLAGCERSLIVVGLALLCATSSEAQPESRGPTERRHVLSMNPLTMILASWFNGEYERRLTSATTVGLSGSRVSFGGEDSFVSVNAAFRYYPGGTALRGFYLGPRIGMFRHRYGPYEDDVDATAHKHMFLGVGFELGYAWLVGVEQHLSISLGGGASRGLGGDPDNAVPMIRLVNVGWAF